MSGKPSAIALHVEAAKRLLRELEQHADDAMNALGRDSGSEFFAAVDERDRILSQLDKVVEAVTHERALAGRGSHAEIESALLNEMAQAAASALESHEQLLMRTRQERDRLSAALGKTDQTDAIANRYSAMSRSGRQRVLSVTG